MTTPIHQCYTCNETFNQPAEPDLMMMVCCYKIIHITCAKEWFSKQPTCMHCRQLLNPKFGGKPLSAIWRVFQIAAQREPEAVCSVFDSEELLQDPDTECAFCCEEFPVPDLYYLPLLHCFCHTTCPINASLETRMTNLSCFTKLSKELIQKNPELKNIFLEKK